MVPGLIPCQHPVICNRKREGSQTGSKNIKSQWFSAPITDWHRLEGMEKSVIVKERRGSEGPAPTIPIRSLFEEWLLPKVSVSRQVSGIKGSLFHNNQIIHGKLVSTEKNTIKHITSQFSMFRYGSSKQGSQEQPVVKGV